MDASIFTANLTVGLLLRK